MVYLFPNCPGAGKRAEMKSEINLNKNNLGGETSLYLLQHKENKVNWQPWSDKLLKVAAENKKLLIISIGYSSCHWCHVMEHESFNDPEVAGLMNTEYIPVKVDREERPDVDQVYMNAAVLMTGQGGWPLNVIALPDGRPVFAGTYFPRKHWILILKKISEYARNDRKALLDSADSVTGGLTRMQIASFGSEEKGRVKDNFNKSGLEVLRDMDPEYGGFGRAPKFPLPAALRSLLVHQYYSGDQSYSDAVKLTLDHMAAGGIYDHIGGGFARYSTDREWKVPHFEKMLYDNAQMLSLYADAYKVFRDTHYQQVVFETAEFMFRELFVNDKKKGISGFSASLDADSDGEEGKYYVWKCDEIRPVAGSDFPLIKTYFNITETGNWEDGKNILYRTPGTWFLGAAGDGEPEGASRIIADFRKDLLKVREKRERPSRDNKIISAWNSLAVSGLLEAYSAFGEDRFYKAGTAILEFIEGCMITDEGGMYRIFDTGSMTSSVNGFLDDYAFTIEALIKCYQVSLEEKWIFLAEKLAAFTLDHFLNDEKSMFYYTSDTDRELIVRTYEIQDNVIPSSNAVMASNLFVIGEILQKKLYSELSLKMTHSMSGNLMKGREYFSKWRSLAGNQAYGLIEIVITGKDALSYRKELDRHFIPGAVYMGGVDGGTLPLVADKTDMTRTFIYVCRDRTCLRPVTDVKGALNLIKSLQNT